MNLIEKEISREYKFESKIFDVAECRAILPDGNEVPRYVVCHMGGVCVLPIDRNGDVIMVRQFRYGVQDVTLEIPAGKLEAGENIDEAIERELEEETGCRAERIEYLGFCYSSPAVSSEKIHIYMASVQASDTPHPDDDEFIEIERYPLEALVDQVMSGEIKDAKTQIAVLKAARILNK